MSKVTYLRPCSVYLKGSLTVTNFAAGDATTTVDQYDPSVLAYLKRDQFITADIKAEPTLSPEELRAQRLTPKTETYPAAPKPAAEPKKDKQPKGKVARVAPESTPVDETPKAEEAPEQTDPDLGNGIKDAPPVERTELETLTGGEVTDVEPIDPPEAKETESDAELAKALLNSGDVTDVSTPDA